MNPAEIQQMQKQFFLVTAPKPATETTLGKLLTTIVAVEDELEQKLRAEEAATTSAKLTAPTAPATATVPAPQPDATGKFVSPAEGAKFMASFGIPQIPLRGKAPWFDNWQDKGSTDFAQIDVWAAEFPGCNFGSIAKPGKHLVLEVDSTDVRRRFEKANPSKTFSAKLRIASRPDCSRGHRWMLHTPESIELGNVPQGFVIGGDFSVRSDDQQCVSPGSVNPITGQQYTVVVPYAEPEPITKEEVEWIRSQKIEKKPTIPVTRDANGLIPHGYIHDQLVVQAGRLRQQGYPVDAVESALLAWAHENCAQPIDDDKVRQVARSSEKWQQGNPASEIVLTHGSGVTAVSENRMPRLDTSEVATRPVFPAWTMRGTSIYEGLVAKAVETSSKHGEFIFMPAVQMMLNSMHHKVHFKAQEVHLNLFLGLISPYGKFFKSSSCNLAYRYFNYAGVATPYEKATRNSEGRVMVTQAGSPEGFGISMSRINGRNAILFYDELGKFVSKAGIESSSFAHDLLTMYEGDDFANNIKNQKESFTFPAGSYCFGWTFCTTDRGFNRHWPKIAGISSGLEDRMFFMVSQKEPRPFVMEPAIDCQQGALETRRILDAAIERGTYDYDDIGQAQRMVQGLDPRSMKLVQKLSLYFAVDLQRESVDFDCLERAVSLVEYRNKAASFLAPIEADNEQGRLQKEMIRELQRNRGKMAHREFCRKLDYTRYGTDKWRAAYYGLSKEEIIIEFTEPSPKNNRAVKMVGLTKFDDDEVS